MYTTKISDTKYEVRMYDWVYTHEEVLMGYLTRDDGVDPEDSDSFYWHFYCDQEELPMNVGFLSKLSKLMSDLNSGDL